MTWAEIEAVLRAGRDRQAIWREARRYLDFWAASETDRQTYGLHAIALLAELACGLDAATAGQVLTEASAVRVRREDFGGMDERECLVSQVYSQCVKLHDSLEYRRVVSLIALVAADLGAA